MGGAALLSSASSARAQQRKAHIAVLASNPWPPIDGLADGLKQVGRDKDKVSIEYAWFQGDPQKLATVADDLVKRGPDVIVTVGTPAILAAKQRTTSIPLVMGLVGDPVESGIIPSLSRPGGNVTGVSVLAAELEPKRLEILKQIVPGLSRVAVLANAATPTA
jgi:putative ABC transport system substrate-binding protein